MEAEGDEAMSFVKEFLLSSDIEQNITPKPSHMQKFFDRRRTLCDIDFD
jgi:hypothetical protein